MAQNITGLTTRTGSCPHGLPIGACPICNGSGGGGSSSKSIERTKAPGEMSWSQCFAAGQLMKQAEARAQERMNSPLFNINISQKVQQNITNYIITTQQLILTIKNSVPPSIAKVIDILDKAVLSPLLNIIDKIPKLMQSVQKLMENCQKILQSVNEKLTALFGEIKNFAEKKISKFLKDSKKKLFGILNLFNTNEDEINDKEFLEVFSSKKD